MQAIVVYVTAKDAAEARRIGETCVRERLAACANIFEGMRSVYWWQGAITDDSEAVLILKSREDLAEKLTERIGQIHSYECPCIICLPVISGNPLFLSWIADNTAHCRNGDP